ncbi:AMP-binding protein [Aurantimonas aggregata]|uniref:AMP-binding protein n=1 Tax=Aurantimonas aggregata TaxID=2047720 RepID=A0A6L9MKR5_9HYPH|nr:class I adenylate-forming enzyme family protein [Aurantimonas aggregata]NDV88222.1 AMP-binding protein [Aurantimonas aggregata]
MTASRNLGKIIVTGRDARKPIFIGLDFDRVETVLTRQDLDEAADAFAHELVGRGIPRGARIGVLAANRPDYIVVLLGAMRAGIIPVPINYRFPPGTIAHILADSDVKLLICDSERRAALPPEAADIPLLCFEDENWDLVRGRFQPFDAIEPRPDEAALILYTSGSTGRPKGVRLSHASHRWVAEVRVGEYHLEEERVLIAAPLYHMNALALSLLVCASGSTAVLLPQFKSQLYIEAIERYGCTWLTAVPPMIAMMLSEKEALSTADLTSVRTIRMGSAPVTGQLIDQVQHVLPNARIINAYGTTEGGPVVFGAHPDGQPAPEGSVGYPHPEVTVRLAGPERGFGTLQMRSPGMMLGYHNRPATPSPFTEDGYYDTGDVFRADAQGFYYFVGRSDDMFVSGGENIFPAEVEAVLDSSPDVLQSCVVPVEDAIKGTKPVAFVVRKPGSAISEAALKAHFLERAPAFQHPRRIWFEEKLLLAPTNKIDRNALRQLAESRIAETPS